MPIPPARSPRQTGSTIGSPFQVKQREHRQHDRHGDQRRPRNDDERHVDDEAQRDRAEQQRRHNSSGAQQLDDRIGQRHGAQCEFLALIDIVLDRNAVLGAGLQRERRIERHDPRHRHQQDAGHQKGDEHPQAARRALEMIEQHRQHQQFRGRADRIEPRAPWRVRPQRSDGRQRKQRDRHRADRTLQRSAGKPSTSRNGSIVTSAATAKIATSDVDQGSESAIRMTKISDRRDPGGRIAPAASTTALPIGFSRHRAHALPPRARSTSDVVLKPGSTSTSSTSPPWASTISWPTTCSRV